MDKSVLRILRNSFSLGAAANSDQLVSASFASLQTKSISSLGPAFYGMNRAAQAGVSPCVALSTKGRRKKLRKDVMQLHSNPPRRKR